jgi:hypothetical protein
MLSLIAWHTLVLLASQEAKVGTSWFKASMAKKKKPVSLKTSCIWSCMFVIPAVQEVEVSRSLSKATLGKNKTLSEK